MAHAPEDEVLRLRSRLHKLEASLLAVRWRLELLESRVTVVEPQVAAMAEADRIAAAVALRVRHDRKLVLSIWTKLYGVALGLLTGADLVARLIHS